jgi:hypothetical protein
MGRPSIVERTTGKLPLRPARNGSPPAAESGVDPLVVLALAFATGILLARMLGWKTRGRSDH